MLACDKLEILKRYFKKLVKKSDMQNVLLDKYAATFKMEHKQ